ncbi:MAG: FAD-dependent oxidoreductase [Bacteroidota bacterium]|nr:FAD-dependent oxidoreductase [Bacteroidota bacterium]
MGRLGGAHGIPPVTSAWQSDYPIGDKGSGRAGTGVRSIGGLDRICDGVAEKDDQRGYIRDSSCKNVSGHIHEHSTSDTVRFMLTRSKKIMDTKSMWEYITPGQPQFPALNSDLEVDVAIIGGGITGITAAMLLSEAGKKVAVLEQLDVGSGTTGYSTGNLYIPTQPYYHTIKSKHGTEAVRTVAHARKDTIDFIEDVVRKYNIACHFSRRPYYIYTSSDKKANELRNELEVLKEVGIHVHEADKMEIPVKFDFAIRFGAQARFNPLKYVTALAKDIAGCGCRIFERTKVLGFDEKNDHCIVRTATANVKARKLIVATHIPKGFNVVQTLAAPYRSYAVAVKLRDGAYPDGEWADMSKQAHVLSTHGINSDHPEIMVLAGSHHKVGQGDAIDHYSHLEQWLREHFSVESIEYRWSAQHYHSADAVPYIGPSTRKSKHTYMATGYFADGLTYGSMAARILTDLILERKNELSKTFDSTRFKPLASAGDFIKENANVFVQYMKDLPPLKSDEDELRKLAPGEGKVVKLNGEKVAAYRDESDKLHVCSAVCTHMACIVNWNAAEKSWDCPCHGSRFTFEGSIIEGPAFTDLEKKIVGDAGK